MGNFEKLFVFLCLIFLFLFFISGLRFLNLFFQPGNNFSDVFIDFDFRGNFVAGVKDGCVVPFSENFPDFRKRKIRHFPAQKHGDLAGEGNSSLPFGGFYFRRFDIKVFADFFFYFIRGYGGFRSGKNIFQNIFFAKGTVIFSSTRLAYPTTRVKAPSSSRMFNFIFSAI